MALRYEGRRRSLRQGYRTGDFFTRLPYIDRSSRTVCRARPACDK
jgi:hypothetical protein